MDLTKLKNKKYIIYDFDGPLVRTKIDWSGWQEKARRIMQKYDPSFNLTGMVHPYSNEFIKRFGEPFLQELRKHNEEYETKYFKPYYLNEELFKFIRENRQLQHYILSSQSRSVLLNILKETGNLELFTEIIARDDVYYIKPDPEGMLRLLKGKNKSDCIFIGDQSSDEEVARSCGVDFQFELLQLN